MNIPCLGDTEIQVGRVKRWAQRALPALRGRAGAELPQPRVRCWLRCTAAVGSLGGGSHGAHTRVLALFLEHLLIALFIWNSEYMCFDLLFLPEKRRKRAELFIGI